MPEPEYRLLDAENVQDPETLLAVLDDIMTTHRMLTRAVAIASVLILHHLGEFKDPPDGDYRQTVDVLKDFLSAVHHDTVNQQVLDAVRDLLSAEE